MIRTYRQSELTAFVACRRAWAWQYWQKLAPKHSGLILPKTWDTGTILHLGLADYYRGLNPLAVVEAEREKRLALVPPEEQDRWIAGWTKTFQLVTTMLRGYVQWVEETGADVGHTTLSVERTITASVGVVLGDEVIMTGTADREYLDDWGILKLMDHKSVDTLTISGQPQKDQQRATYSVLRLIEEGETYKGAVHNMLRRVGRSARAVPPFYGRHEVVFNEAHLLQHSRHMLRILKDMVGAQQEIEAAFERGDEYGKDIAGEVLFPHPTKDCSWKCPFLAVCPMRDDGSDWEWYLSEWFERAATELTGEEDA